MVYSVARSSPPPKMMPHRPAGPTRPLAWGAYGPYSLILLAHTSPLIPPRKLLRRLLVVMVTPHGPGRPSSPKGWGTRYARPFFLRVVGGSAPKPPLILRGFVPQPLIICYYSSEVPSSPPPRTLTPHSFSRLVI